MNTRQKTVAAILVGVLVAAVGSSWFFLGGNSIVDETLAVQTTLLSGDVPGRDRKAGVTQVTRNIDKMGREDVKVVREAFMADWRRLRQQGIDEYFAASEPDREPLLDRDIGRLVIAGALWFATNPRSNGLPPKPGKEKQTARKPVKPKVTPAVQLLDTYRIALLAQARKRGITVPDWLLKLR